jgi:hypothetical protein
MRPQLGTLFLVYVDYVRSFCLRLPFYCFPHLLYPNGYEESSEKGC